VTAEADHVRLVNGEAAEILSKPYDEKDLIVAVERVGRPSATTNAIDTGRGQRPPNAVLISHSSVSGRVADMRRERNPNLMRNPSAMPFGQQLPADAR
jgi:hypothetical protein